MAGEFKVNGVSFATESGGTLTVNNSKVRLPSSGNGIEDSSGNSVLSESGGNISLTAKNATVTGDFVPSEPMMFRNKIINGDMRISQRGDSTGVTTTTYGGPDRFQSILGTAGTWSLSKSTDAPSGSGFSNSFKWDCTTANNSLSASSILMFGQKIEGQNVQDLAYGTSSAKNITLSFWVKSNLTGTYILEFFKETGSRQINRSYTINSANTWEHKSVTIPGDTSGALANDNTAEFAVYWWLVAGSDFTSGTLNTSAWANSTNANRAVGQVNLASSTSNEIYITGVQLEVGSSATPFEHRPIGMELGLCKRYYATGRVSGLVGYAGGRLSSFTDVNFEVEMRAIPTAYVSYNGTAGTIRDNNNGTALNGWTTIEGTNQYIAVRNSSDSVGAANHHFSTTYFANSEL